MKKDVVGMDRPASEDLPFISMDLHLVCKEILELKERVADYHYNQNEIEQYVYKLEKRVAKLEMWAGGEDDQGSRLLERVATLEKRVDSTVLCRQELTERVARLERYVESLEEYTGVPSPIPWGDLD